MAVKLGMPCVLHWLMSMTLLLSTLTSVKLLLFKVVESFGEKYFISYYPSKKSL